MRPSHPGRWLAVTTPSRTALDIACRYPVGKAVAAVDSLARATHLKIADVELLAERYKGRRGIRKARKAVDLVDAGAESPRETWLRLLLIRAGFPRPQTQIPVYDEYGQLIAVLDMGWEECMFAVEYDGEHHRTDPLQYRKDIRRLETLQRLGWIVIRVGRRRPSRRYPAARAICPRREEIDCEHGVFSVKSGRSNDRNPALRSLSTPRLDTRRRGSRQPS